MSRGRRAALLAGLAILLGALAASDVAGRESALEARIGRPTPVVVAVKPIREGAKIDPRALAVRSVPARWVPREAFHDPNELAGVTAAVAIPAGTTLQPALLDEGADDAPPGPQLRRGERVGEVVARGDPALVLPGGRVDVLVTREGQGGSAGRTTLALEDAEVLSSRAAPSQRSDDDGGPRVRVELRVTVRQAVALAAAQDFAREIRVLPRAAGDRSRGLQGLAAGASG